jgi:ATP synthase protein I
MKLISRNARVRTEDPLGHGMEAGLVLVLFTGGGYWLDQVLDTTPLFVIAFALLGAVGLFAKLKYSYDARMEELQQRRSQTSRFHEKKRAA